MVPSQLARNLVQTIAYCDQFGYPLTEAEVRQRLIQSPRLIRVGDSGNQSRLIHQQLTQLVAGHTLGFQAGFYFLLGSEAAVNLRRQRSIYSSLKMAEAQAVVAALKVIPWIKGIAITGSLAMANATQDDDLDFMIITQSNRLWLTRPLVIAYAWLKGKRRSWQREEKNSWCFNLWLEEDELHAPGLNQSLYTAYEVCQARFVLSRDRVEQRFIWANQWVSHYLPIYFVERAEIATQASSSSSPWYRILTVADAALAGLLQLVNEVAFWLQWVYMSPHRTREKVTRSLAFFHPRDTKKVVTERLKATLSKLNH